MFPLDFYGCPAIYLFNCLSYLFFTHNILRESYMFRIFSNSNWLYFSSVVMEDKLSLMGTLLNFTMYVCNCGMGYSRLAGLQYSSLCEIENNR